MFSDKQLAQAVKCPMVRAVRWGSTLRTAMQRNGITTGRRAAHFIAQVGHESIGLWRVEEDLNYSAPRLREVFPGYFDEKTAIRYARQPEHIANRVYASRMGNGNERSGDGWRFRGRGLIQITGRNNYRRIGELLDLPLLDSPQLLIEIETAAASAAAYWRDNGLNALADGGDVLMVSRKLNLGDANSRRTPNGISDRITRTNRALAVLGVR